MHIDWDWVLQRPQLIAQKLNKVFSCDVLCVNRIGKKQTSVVTNKRTQKIRSIKLFPLVYKIPLLRLINKGIIRISIKFNDYDFVWICYPEFIDYIPSSYKGKILYDCMDNYSEMTSGKANVCGIKQAEARAITKANMVFASSNYLYRRIKTSFPNAKCSLVRNGYVNFALEPIKQACVRPIYHLAYFGTVAPWIDLPLMNEIVDQFNNLRIDFVGPRDTPCESSDKICFMQPVPHADLTSLSRKYDCLIMPFKITQLIEAVDPVKLYEYIGFGQCIISVEYDEIKRFSDFVYFYKTKAELVTLLNLLEKKGFPPKYTKEEQHTFLKENTWDSRIKSVIHSIDNINGVCNAG
jgi:hypothetical protein